MATTKNNLRDARKAALALHEALTAQLYQLAIERQKADATGDQVLVKSIDGQLSSLWSLHESALNVNLSLQQFA